MFCAQTAYNERIMVDHICPNIPPMKLMNEFRRNLVFLLSVEDLTILLLHAQLNTYQHKYLRFILQVYVW